MLLLDAYGRPVAGGRPYVKQDAIQRMVTQMLAEHPEMVLRPVIPDWLGRPGDAFATKREV